MTAVSLAQLGEPERELAWSRWRVIAPCVEDGVPLTTATDHLVVFTPSGRRGRFEAGTTVLDAARSLGVDIDSRGDVTGAFEALARGLDGHVIRREEPEQVG